MQLAINHITEPVVENMNHWLAEEAEYAVADPRADPLLSFLYPNSTSGILANLIDEFLTSLFHKS